MARIRAGRYTADLEGVDGEIVVFLIGMRVNRPWKVPRWWPVFSAMPRMLRHLEQHPEKRVRTTDIETIYGNMPPRGLAAAVGAVPVRRGRDSAAARIGARTEDDPALPPY